MTVTITQDINDIEGIDDNTAWTFFTSALRLSDGEDAIISTKPKRRHPVAGVLTVELDSGPAVVIAPDGKHYTFTVPETDSELWPLIQAAVTIPPSTAHQQLQDAVDDWLERFTNLWDLIPGKPAVIAAGATQAAARAVIGALSSAEISTLITSATNALINGAPGALDTLKELADALGGDANFSTTVLNALAARVVQWDTSNVSSIVGSGIIKNTDRDWYGTSYNAGNVGNSFGFPGSPTVAETPVATITSNVTFPLFNATIPVSDLAGFQFEAGSFTLGGVRVGYLGRSAASGAGNLTGCYTKAVATGTVTSGTALSNTPNGFVGLSVYQRFGYDGRPNPCTTQAFAVVGSWQSPTLDDSAEAGSFVAVMADSGSQQTQRQTVTGGEMTAILANNWLMPTGVTAGLVGGGVRTEMAAGSRAKSVQGIRTGPTHDVGSYADNYDAVYQNGTGYQPYGLVNGAVSAGAGLTIAFDGATVRPPTPTTGFPGAVWIGSNASGIGGQLVTYTGITGSGTTGTLTGATASLAIADNARISNRTIGGNFVDQVISQAGFVLGASAYSGNFSLALRGNPDSINSMFSLTGPTQADSVSGGLVQMRLNPGSDQTTSIIQIFNTAGTLTNALSPAGILFNRNQIIGQTANGATSTLALIGTTGAIQPGTTAGVGIHIYSGSGAPSISAASGDLYFRSDPTTAAQLVYRCTGTTNWVNALTAISTDDTTDGTTTKAFLATERTKLAGIAAGATAGITRSIVSVTTATTLSATALTDVVALIGASGAPTLPTAVANANKYTLKNVDTTSKTVATTSSQTIDGSTTVTLNPLASIDVISDGTNWMVI